MSKEIKLLPCPCCESEAKIGILEKHFTFYQAVCLECGLTAKATPTPELTASLWNTRKPMENLDKQISSLYEDCENGAEDDVVLGWNRAIDKVREIIKVGGKQMCMSVCVVADYLKVNCKDLYDEIYNRGYKDSFNVDRTEERNKAIDDFADKMKRLYPLMENGFGLINHTLHENIEQVAEQLKGGGVDG